MSIPMPQSMDQEPVTWTLAHTTGRESLAGARGFVRFEPTAHAVAFPSMTVLPRPVEARVVAGVMETVDLMVNDPGLWNWRVTPEVGVPWTPFHVDVPGPVDLAAVVVVPGKGPIRAVTGPPGTTAWADLTGKPATYPSTIPEVGGLQAALPRIDTSAGTRVFVGDTMLYGETGWRDLTPYLGAGVTPSSSIPDARFRRVGDMVEFAMKVDLANDFTSNVICTFPVGFRAPGYRYLPGAYTGPGKGAGASAMVPIDMIGYVSATVLQTPTSNRLPSGSTLIWSGRFDTNDPWPTTLPGTPA